MCASTFGQCTLLARWVYARLCFCCMPTSQSLSASLSLLLGSAIFSVSSLIKEIYTTVNLYAPARPSTENDGIGRWSRQEVTTALSTSQTFSVIFSSNLTSLTSNMIFTRLIGIYDHAPARASTIKRRWRRRRWSAKHLPSQRVLCCGNTCLHYSLSFNYCLRCR